MGRRILNPREVSVSEIISRFEEHRGAIAVDTESGKVRGQLGISLDNGESNTYLPINHYDIPNLTGEEKQRLTAVMQRADSLIFHNSPYDVCDVLIPNGLLHDWPAKFWDTMNMAHWINENRNSYKLQDVSLSLGGKPKKVDSAFATVTSMSWDDLPFDMAFPYAANDAEITFDAWKAMIPEFITQGFAGELWDWEQRFIKAMKALVVEGIRIDPGVCAREIFKGRAAMAECKAALGFKATDTLGPKNLAILFFDRLGLPVVKRTPSGAPCFDKHAMKEYDEMLEGMKSAEAKIVLRYRGWQKTVSSNYEAYIKFMDANHILHPGYKLHGTVTGRLSCSDPNLQQIPRMSDKEWNGNLEAAFIPKEGKRLWKLDYSQLQFRLIAAYAEEQSLLQIFASDRDLFTEMAQETGWLTRPPATNDGRYDTKTFSYATNFGAGAQRISDIFHISKSQAQGMLTHFDRTYPNIAKIRRKANALATQRGYVKYWTGRRRHFLFPESEGHKGWNAIIQGGEAEIVKRALVEIQETVCDDDCKLVLQIHDAIVPEITEGKEGEYLPRIVKIMENPRYDFGVNFKVDCKEWGKKEK